MFEILLFALKWFSVLFGPFIISIGFWYFYFRLIKKIKPIPNETNSYRYGSILKRIFIDFPRQFAYDRLTLDPNTFKPYGLHLICGEQGSGKSILLAYLIRMYKHIYPRCKVVSNFDCKLQDDELKTWEQLTLDTNGIYGEIDCIDEIQNWFSSNDSKNFPPDMLSVITQQRKVRRCILATSQVFTRTAKPIRENTYLMYYPFTVFGCITFVRVYKPILKDDGTLKEKKLRKFFFFVHDKELRGMYDTYKTIVKLRNSGFKPMSEQLKSDEYIQLNSDILKN